MTRKVQTVQAPKECPGCGAWVCLEFPPGRPQNAVFHCGADHDDHGATCGWRAPINVNVDPDLDELIVAFEHDIPERYTS